MRIVVNTIFLKGYKLVAVNYFINKIFNCLAKQYPEHEFLFLVNSENCNLYEVEPGIKLVVVSSNPKNIFSLNYWNEVKLPMTLRSIRPDVVVQPFGFCSLLTSVAQLLVVHDLGLEKRHLIFSDLHYCWIFRKSLKKAKQIIALSEFYRNDIIDHYKVDPEKIDVVTAAAKDIYKPVTYSFQQNIKEQYSAGKEYFLYAGDFQQSENLMNLLKAFSQFKKWQHSNMKLLIVKARWEQNNKWVDKLKLYKLRAEVVILEELLDEELANITASAYALLFPSFSGGLKVSALEAMQCGTPVIMNDSVRMTENKENFFLYANQEKPESIAKQMLKLYKDEPYRFSLIEEGQSHASQFSWDKSAARIWQSILKVTGQ